MTTLLEAVDALTKRWSHRVDQGERTTIVRHRPRLQMLEDAILTSTNKDGGGVLAKERTIFDATAAQMLIDYRRRINQIAAKLDIPAGQPIPTLRAWHAATLAKITNDAWEAEYIDTFTRWATEIDDYLNPPQQVTIEQACPMCEAAFFTDKTDKTLKPWPLRARKWDIAQHGTDKADATCIVCNARWDGMTAIRELAYHLESNTAEEVA